MIKMDYLISLIYLIFFILEKYTDSDLTDLFIYVILTILTVLVVLILLINHLKGNKRHFIKEEKTLHNEREMVLVRFENGKFLFQNYFFFFMKCPYTILKIFCFFFHVKIWWFSLSHFFINYYCSSFPFFLVMMLFLIESMYHLKFYKIICIWFLHKAFLFY